MRTGIRLVVGEEGALIMTASRVDEPADHGERRRADGERDDAGHFRAGGRTAGEGSSAERAQLRSAADAESRHREFHFGEDGRDRDFQLHDGNNFAVSGNRPQQNLFC